jgi:hypothetical protein
MNVRILIGLCCLCGVACAPVDVGLAEQSGDGVPDEAADRNNGGVGDDSSRNNDGTDGLDNGGDGTNNGGRPDNNGTTPRPDDGQPYCEPGGPEFCDDDIDNDCDGLVDEACACTQSEKPCYSGDPAELGAENGQCRQGTQVCELEFYSECAGEVRPSAEVCDGLDNDCDGMVDEEGDCNNVPPVAICPSEQSGPPLATYDFVGGYEDTEGDRMVRAAWTVVDHPVGSTAVTAPASGLDARIFADVQGIYTLELEVEDERGGIGRCLARLETTGTDELRIEMTWNIGAPGDKFDMDMHLLKSPSATWFDGGSAGEDCYWANCRVCNASPTLGQSFEDACREQISEYNENGEGPPGTVVWFPPLDANDPRLDLDDVDGNGPENINVKLPRDGTHRLGVHYWDAEGFGDATVTIRIFCGGRLAEEFEPVVMRERDSFGGDDTEFWEVADIVWDDAGCTVRSFGERGCRQICSREEAEAGGCPSGRERGRRCR